ncbi:YafY family transcriptional regulator [Streptomyces kaniharaensis]|uniref:YafY family transcriptional regulator n=1 Tax=Streptomyces kaniharaensis TaxID=212423 RepID=A0A6N7KJV0_9ACTN|nr:YafY family protein [Streptomyces kaniharaensis]MQS10839.1 YafY family transcriptional regulator [Streptomyces kaniharaensis]
MKSSRLLSILLMLQTNGRMTAQRLAEELEVSVRTVYRDVEALQAAGVPVYADAGHGGGYQVLAGYRTRLTGLNAGEAEALFLSGLPGPAAALGLGPALAAAQLKLRAALPPELRADADRMRARFHLEAPGWYAEDDDVPYLPQVADAVWRGRVLQVRYRRWKEPTDVDRRLEPYGLVLKAGRWYVVAGPGPRTFRVDQILELVELEEEFTPPDDFFLAAWWRRYEADFHARLHRAEAVVLLAPGAAARLGGAAARAAGATGTPEPDGRTRVVLPIESLDQAHAAFLALGTDVEVLAPPELRARLADTARALAHRYTGT